MRARTAIAGTQLASLVEAALTKVGYGYRKNQGRGLTEFEVVQPCHFLVKVEDLTWTSVLPFRRKPRVESAIEVVRVLGTQEPEEEVRRHTSVFLKELRAASPKSPWKGLGPVGSRSERSNWERLEEL